MIALHAMERFERGDNLNKSLLCHWIDESVWIHSPNDELNVSGIPSHHLDPERPGRTSNRKSIPLTIRIKSQFKSSTFIGTTVEPKPNQIKSEPNEQSFTFKYVNYNNKNRNNSYRPVQGFTMRISFDKFDRTSNVNNNRLLFMNGWIRFRPNTSIRIAVLVVLSVQLLLLFFIWFIELIFNE